MNQKIKLAVEEYQCSGCVNGHNISCFKGDKHSQACSKHVPGTMILGLGTIFLGMPKGFDRQGPCKETTINIFETFNNEKYDFLNIPVWKFKDKNGNTLVRGIRPRLSFPFIHIYLEDCMKKINCYELTKEDIDKID